MQDAYAPVSRYYDLEHAHFTADIELYANLFQPGPLLEIGVGTGRVAHALAGRGFEVWGVDPSAAMLRRAAEQPAREGALHLLEGSILDVTLHRVFPAVILTLNTLWHFTSAASQQACLNAVRRALDPQGLLCVDLSNPLTLADRGAAGEMRMRFCTTVEQDIVTCIAAAWDREETQRLDLQLLYDTTSPDGAVSRTHASLELRYVYPDELLVMLQRAGLEALHTYGSYDLDPFSDDSPNLIVVAGTV